jgi:hypothetical protein
MSSTSPHNLPTTQPALPAPLPHSPFSTSYAEARQKFMAAAKARGLALQSHIHPLPGLHGEELALDIARLGDADAPKALLLSSACHGIEGYCGSGLQVAVLQNTALCDAYLRAGVTLYFLHALNPHGFSHARRVTEDNVDLNRNVRDFSLAAALVPNNWPPSADNEAVLGSFVARRGMKAYQAAVTGGQCDHPQGVFYGGRAATWSQRTLRRFFREQGQSWRHLGWIDVHTGLGPNGHGERIFANADDARALARTRAWWGDTVTSIYDGSSSSALLNGLLWLAVLEDCPKAEFTSIALEYGTEPVEVVLNAVRASAWLGAHPEAPPEQAAAIRTQVREAFCTDTEAWREAILRQGVDALQGALKGLQSTGQG